MYENFHVIEAKKEHASFVFTFYDENRAILHGEFISEEEWETILSLGDPDEINFLIYRDDIPCAWFRVNSLLNEEAAWLSMLVVGRSYQRQGIGRFAVGYAEHFVRERGFRELRIRTDRDNFPAQACYRSLGYHEFMTYDIDETGICFSKVI